MQHKTSEIAKILNISERQVRRLVEKKLLLAEKEGKDYVVSDEALASYEQGHTKKIKAALDKLIQSSDLMVASPETIKYLEDKKVGVKSNFVTYEQYLDDLFKKRKNEALERVKVLPELDPSIANTAVEALYQEFRECFVMGVNGAALTLSIVLLELAMKYRLFKEKNKETSWRKIEKYDFKTCVNELSQLRTINEDQAQQLMDFNSEIRNSYIHYKIEKIVSQLFIKELPALDVHTGEVTIHRDVDVKNFPQLWFSAKQKVDRERLIGVSRYSLDWVNRLLGDKA